jgi:hypothetical protein
MVSASPSPGSGTPPPVAKQQVSSASTCHAQRALRRRPPAKRVFGVGCAVRCSARSGSGVAVGACSAESFSTSTCVIVLCSSCGARLFSSLSISISAIPKFFAPASAADQA